MKDADALKTSSASTTASSSKNYSTKRPKSCSIFTKTYKLFNQTKSDGLNLINFETNLDINDAKEHAYQIIIVIAALFSFTSLLCLCLIIPTMYNYVDIMGKFSKQDFAYCEVLVQFFLL